MPLTMPVKDVERVDDHDSDDLVRGALNEAQPRALEVPACPYSTKVSNLEG